MKKKNLKISTKKLVKNKNKNINNKINIPVIYYLDVILNEIFIE